MTTWWERGVLIRLTASLFRELLSIRVCVRLFLLIFEGGMLSLIVLVPGHCISFYFTLKSVVKNLYFLQYREWYSKLTDNKLNLHFNGIRLEIFVYACIFCILLKFINRKTVQYLSVVSPSINVTELSR